MVVIAPSTRTLTLTLPMPPKALSPNARVHRLSKAAVASEYRQSIWLDALAQLQERYGAVVPLPLRMAAVFTFVTKDNRRRDLDNWLAACKPLLDGLVDAGILIDDSTRYLASITVTRRVDKGIDAPYVEVALHQAEAEADE